MSGPFDLQRFVDAQDRGGTYDGALAELRDGRKTSHWMWFVFPQIAGLGTARWRSGTRSLARRGRAYLAHPVLGPPPARVGGALTGLDTRSPEELPGRDRRAEAAVLDDAVPARGARRAAVRTGARPVLRRDRRRRDGRPPLTPTCAIATRRYRQTARGAKTTTIPTAQISPIQIWLSIGVPTSRWRSESTHSEIGLMSAANVFSGSGIESGGTNALDTNVSGNSQMKLACWPPRRSDTPIAITADSHENAKPTSAAARSPRRCRRRSC